MVKSNVGATSELNDGSCEPRPGDGNETPGSRCSRCIARDAECTYFDAMQVRPLVRAVTKLTSSFISVQHTLQGGAQYTSPADMYAINFV